MSDQHGLGQMGSGNVLYCTSQVPCLAVCTSQGPRKLEDQFGLIVNLVERARLATRAWIILCVCGPRCKLGGAAPPSAALGRAGLDRMVSRGVCRNLLIMRKARLSPWRNSRSLFDHPGGTHIGGLHLFCGVVGVVERVAGYAILVRSVSSDALGWYGLLCVL